MLKIFYCVAAVVLLFSAFGYSCPTECQCGIETVECSAKALRVWPEGIPTNATDILMTDNLISKLDENVLIPFQSLKSLALDSNKLNQLTLKIPPSLERLSLSMNYLFSLEIKPSTENAIINLLYLKLDVNRLRQIPKLPNSLKTINVAGNQIKVLPEDTFKGLSEIEEIYLQYNQIEVFQNYTFDNLTHLRTLDIRSNMHTELLYHWFTDKPKLSTILLTTVYLNCDCEIVNIHYALEKLPIEEEDFDEIHCYTPEEIRGTLVKEMLKMDNYTNCVEEVNEARRQKAVGITIAVVLVGVVILVALVIFVLYCLKKERSKFVEL